MSKVISMYLKKDIYDMIKEIADLNDMTVQEFMRRATIDELLWMQQEEQ